MSEERGHEHPRGTTPAGAGGERRRMWDERYAASAHVWSAEPNAEVERIVGDWEPGRALDLGASEGRHAVWLAAKRWRVRPS